MTRTSSATEKTSLLSGPKTDNKTSAKPAMGPRKPNFFGRLVVDLGSKAAQEAKDMLKNFVTPEEREPLLAVKQRNFGTITLPRRV